MIKRNGKPIEPVAAEENGATNGVSLEFKENDRVNAQIDGFIKENPTYWEQLKTMPRERLERTVVLQQLRYNYRSQKLNNGLIRKIEDDPKLKEACDALVKLVPEAERETARVRIARTLVFSKSRAEKQQAQNAVGV